MNRLLSLSCLATSLALFGLAACGDDSADDAPASTGGQGGSAAGAGGSGGSSGSSGQGGAGVGGMGGAGQTGASGSSGQAGGPACSKTDPPPTDAVFVAPDGSATNDGSVDKPLASVQAALDAAIALNKPRVVIAAGSYNEPLAIGTLTAPLTVEGGWQREGGAWVRICAKDSSLRRPSLTTTATTGQPVVTLTSPGQPVVLRALRIETKAQGAPGETLIGVWAKGGEVTLEDVEVESGRAGDGVVKGEPGPAPGLVGCNGLTDCPEVGAGESGLNGANGAAAQGSGTFGESGFTPGDGGEGKAGEPGKNGKAGTDGGTITCFNCEKVGTSMCQEAPSTASTGEKGKCGCGSLGGNSGEPGVGGGASVGLLATGQAKLNVAASKLTSGEGGDGVEGTDGGDTINGGEGADGAAGPSCEKKQGGVSCVFTVDETCNVLGSVSGQGPGGAKGTAGGKGGKGGKGGAGAGGPSYAVVTVGTASFSADAASTLTAGKGGTGAGEGKTKAVDGASKKEEKF